MLGNSLQIIISLLWQNVEFYSLKIPLAHYLGDVFTEYFFPSKYQMLRLIQLRSEPKLSGFGASGLSVSSPTCPLVPIF